MNSESELARYHLVNNLSKTWALRAHSEKNWQVSMQSQFLYCRENLDGDERIYSFCTWVTCFGTGLAALWFYNNPGKIYQAGHTVWSTLLVVFCVGVIYLRIRFASHAKEMRSKPYEDPRWRRFFGVYHKFARRFGIDPERHFEKNRMMRDVPLELSLRITQLKARQKDPCYAFDVLAERKQLEEDYDLAWILGVVNKHFEQAMVQNKTKQPTPVEV